MPPLTESSRYQEPCEPCPQQANRGRGTRRLARQSGWFAGIIAALVGVATITTAPAAASESGSSFEPGYAMSKQYVAVTAYKILRDHAPSTVGGCASDVKSEPDRFVDLGGAGAFTRGAINCLDRLGYLAGLPGGSSQDGSRSFEPDYAMSKQYVAVTAYKILRDHAPSTVVGCASDVKSEPDRFVDLGGAGAFTRGAISCLDKLGYLTGLPAASKATSPVATGDETLEALLARAKERRDGLVAQLTNGIRSGAYGVGGDNVLRGPAGFRIDLDDCPDGWSDTAGITRSSIRIGHPTPRSGILAQYGKAADGLRNYFDWINENDPVRVDGSPRALKLIIKDDKYIAAETIEAVTELIEAENAFSILTFGSPGTFGTYDRINAECVPNPFVMGSDAAWGDPVNYPWTTGMQLSRSTEAILWGEWIKENFQDKLPVKVAALVMDTNFGNVYQDSFENWAQANPDVVSDFLPVRHSFESASFWQDVKNVRSFDPQVLLLMTAGEYCAKAIQNAGKTGLYRDIRNRGGVLFSNSHCRDIGVNMRPAGADADSWWVVGGDTSSFSAGLKDAADPMQANEPFVKLMRGNLQAARLGSAKWLPLRTYGYAIGYPYAEALHVAAKLPGGLTRANFILAVRSLSIRHPLYLDGITGEFNGNKDAYFIEGSDISRFDSVSQSWVLHSVIDVNGSTPRCAWDEDSQRCR